MSSHPVRRKTAKPLNLLRAALLNEIRQMVLNDIENHMCRNDKCDPAEDEAFVKAVNFIANIMDRHEKEQGWLGSKPD